MGVQVLWVLHSINTLPGKYGNLPSAAVSLSSLQSWPWDAREVPPSPWQLVQGSPAHQGLCSRHSQVSWNTSKCSQKWNQSMARVSLGKLWGIIVNSMLLLQTIINRRCQNQCMQQGNQSIYFIWNALSRESKTNCVQPVNSFLDSLHCSPSCVLELLSVFF